MENGNATPPLVSPTREGGRFRGPNYLLLGTLWILLYVFAIVLPLLGLLLGPLPPGREFLRELSVGFGFAGASIMCVQFALTARFRRAQAPFGIDLVYHFHREISYVALGLVLLHPLLLIVLDPDFASLFNVVSAPWRARFAVTAVVALLAIIVTSAYRRTLRIPYERWRRIHAILAVVVVGMSVAHIEGVGHYVNTPAKRAIWIAYPLFWICLLVWTQVVKPLLVRRRPYAIISVKPDAEQTWTITAEPEGHMGLAFRPGQFAWLSLDRKPFAHREHPFSFSSGLDDLPRLSFTIRERGDFTSRVGTLRPGARVYLDGPYGHFSYQRHPAPGYIFVVGGIGITPVMSMLRSLAAAQDARPLHLIYASTTLERATFCAELEELSNRLDLQTVHVLSSPSPGWTGERGRLDPEMLMRLLPPDVEGRHFFVCGPAELMDMVERTLLRHGISFGRVHSERFDLV